MCPDTVLKGRRPLYKHCLQHMQGRDHILQIRVRHLYNLVDIGISSTMGMDEKDVGVKENYIREIPNLGLITSRDTVKHTGNFFTYPKYKFEQGGD